MYVLIEVVSRPRPMWQLFTTSAVIGLVQSLAVFPLSLVGGFGPFWIFPRGTIPNSINDMATALVGYTYLQHSPWRLPLLFTTNLGVPGGTNIFWLDAVPWIDLLGKAAFTLSGVPVNLLGIHLLLSLALPGVAMTTVLAAAGERSFLSAVSGTLLAESTPWLLYRWGHIALLAQYLIIGALALYIATLRSPRDRRIQICWITLMVITLLTNIYLLAMATIFWLASILQRGIDRTVSWQTLIGQTLALIAAIVGVAAITGILSFDLLRSGSKGGFGYYSMNLLSPFAMQMSGLFPPAAHAIVTGDLGQYEGYAYLGAGCLLLIGAGALALGTWLRASARHHMVLLILLIGCLIVALSNRVYAGHFLALNIPLPSALVHMLGAFRSSGRFFWPVGYTIIAATLLTQLRSPRRVYSTMLIAFACVLQVVDTNPLREGIMRSAVTPVDPVLARNQLLTLVAPARAEMVFPSYGCVDGAANTHNLTPTATLLLKRANLELQLAAARANIPTNSVYNARLPTDCVTERVNEAARPVPGTLYIYLREPDASGALLYPVPQRAGCHMLASFAYCFIPTPAGATALTTPPTTIPAKLVGNGGVD